MLFSCFSFVLWIEVIHHVWQEVNVVFVIDFLRREGANLTIFKRQLISQNPVLLLKKISFIKCSSLSNSLIDTILITQILQPLLSKLFQTRLMVFSVFFDFEFIYLLFQRRALI